MPGCGEQEVDQEISRHGGVMENEGGGVENLENRGDVPCGAVLGAIVRLVGTLRESISQIHPRLLRLHDDSDDMVTQTIVDQYEVMIRDVRVSVRSHAAEPHVCFL